MEICLQPVGNVETETLYFLKERLEDVFGECKILKAIELPTKAYNPKRNQYNSRIILMKIPISCDIVLGVTEVDLYAYTFNFIFGEAELEGKRAIISLARLDPEFYGKEKNSSLLKIRALKEAMHEIGHVLGLMHCRNKKCVMYFSNTIFDTDYKDWKYCKTCLKWLEVKGIKVNLQ